MWVITTSCSSFRSITSSKIKYTRHRRIIMTQVWDCFLFNDELDLLSFRLSELEECVNFFVLVEATRTFRGDAKPLHYAENQSRYECYSSKIRHIVVEDMPALVDTPFMREKHQHAAILKGLVGVQPDDLVLVGDVDEIPKREVVRELQSQMKEPTRLVINHSIYFANWKLPIQWTDGTMACRGNQLEDRTMGLVLGKPDALWEERTDRMVNHAGWHLSFLGGLDAINKKLGEFSHTEADSLKIRHNKHLENCVRLGVDFSGKFILKPMSEAELDPMLRRLQVQWPDTFSFPKRWNFFVAMVYRGYTSLRNQDILPSQLIEVIDSHVSISLLVLAVPVMIYDFIWRTALRYRLRHRLRKLHHRFFRLQQDVQPR